MNLHRIFTRLTSDVPLMDAGSLNALLMSMRNLQQHERGDSEWAKGIKERYKPIVEIDDEIAIVRLDGLMMLKPDAWDHYLFGAIDTKQVAQEIDKLAANAGIKAILLSVDSGGGYAMGTPELAESIRNARRQKPVNAHVEGMAASAAYWVASQAEHVIATESSVVGSIGTYLQLADWTEFYRSMGIDVQVITNKEGKYKAIGVPGNKLNKDQVSHLQEHVNRVHEGFKTAVQTARPQIKDEAYTALTASGKYAKELGLIDAIGSEKYARQFTKHAIK